MGITTNLVSDQVSKWSPHWLWLTCSALLTLMVALYFIKQVYSKGYSTDALIELLLPFRVAPDKSEILIARPYPITRLMRQSFHGMMNNDENRNAFLKDWHQALEKKERPFRGMVRRCVKDLLVYAVLDALREYSEQTLTIKWVFTGHRWRPIRLSFHDIPTPAWPLRLQENLCFQDQGISTPQVIKIPGELMLDVKDYREAGGFESTEVILISQYGKVVFSISPHTHRVSARSREGAILYKYCDVDEQTELWVAKYFIQLRADFSGLRIFGRHFREDFLPWVEGLFECVRNELDWQLCLERDLERMVVGLTERMETLLPSQTR